MHKPHKMLEDRLLLENAELREQLKVAKALAIGDEWTRELIEKLARFMEYDVRSSHTSYRGSGEWADLHDHWRARPL